MVGPDANRTEKAGEDEFAALNVARALRHEIVANDPEMRPQVKNIPFAGAKDVERCVRAEERIALAGDRFDERRFTTAVWPKDGYVLTRFDVEAQSIECEPAIAFDIDVLKRE